VTSLALSHDDRWLITGGGRGTVLIYDRERDFKTKLVSRQPHAKRIEQIVLLPDGFHFVSLDRDGRAFLWDARESPQEPKPLLANRPCKQIVAGHRVVR
jgi:WD40 repeat protein